MKANSKRKVFGDAVDLLMYAKNYQKKWKDNVCICEES